MPNDDIIRPKTTNPITSTSIDKAMIDAQVAHEQHIGYYLNHTELGIIDEEQQAIEALVTACEEIHLYLPATKRFFVRQRELSSGVKGVGRVQGKEVVTAGSWPMAMYSTEKPSLWDRAMSLMGRGKPAQEGTK
jgi:hypothetical protein